MTRPVRNSRVLIERLVGPLKLSFIKRGSTYWLRVDHANLQDIFLGVRKLGSDPLVAAHSFDSISERMKAWSRMQT